MAKVSGPEVDTSVGPAVPSRRIIRVLAVAGLVAAVGMRLWILSNGLGAVDADEAVSGLMARHAARGEFVMFFWGQAYGGTHEAIATAIPFLLFGAGRITLKLVPIAATGATAWLVWRIGRRTIGPERAPVAAVLFLLGPGFFVMRSTRAYGFYSTGLLVGTAILLVALRLRAQERVTTAELAGLGFLVGVGWWATAQVTFVAVPALVWLAVTAPEVRRRASVVALGGLLGAAPWLIWSATHGWASLQTNFSAPENTYWSHLRHFFHPLLPQALGIRHPHGFGWIGGPVVGWAVYAGLLAGFVILLRKRPAGLSLLLAVATAYPFLFSVSPASYYTGEPRYLYLLSPVIALLVAYALTTAVRQVAVVAVVFALSSVTLVKIEGDYPITPKARLDPLITALEDHGVDRVFTPYQLAYRLAFDSEERIIATPIDIVRYVPWQELVRTSPLPGYVLIHGSEEQFRLEVVLTHTENLRHHMRVGVFDVYVPRTKLLPEQWLPA